jgi:hypothetical protein
MPPANARDLRIDAIRGVALLLITVDHIEWFSGSSLLQQFTLHGLSFCDAAEVFVFISGIVCGIVYSPVLETKGLGACQLKATRRAAYLYLANLLTLWAIFTLVTLLAEFGIADKGSFHLRALLESPVDMLPNVVLQFYQPFAFDVLTLYCHLLLALPVFLSGLMKRPKVTWGVVMGLYLFAQAFPMINYPIFVSRFEVLSTRSRPFNHFAWFMLFFLGSAFGNSYSRGRRITIPHWLMAAAILTTAIIASMKLSVSHPGVVPLGARLSYVMEQFRDLGLLSKSQLGALRLLAFFSLVVITMRLAPNTIDPKHHPISRAIVGAGQNALFLFCLSIILVFSTDVLFAFLPKESSTIAACHVAVCGSLLAIGYWRCKVINMTRAGA